MARIKKVLVANRGEIAIRIFRACSDMGIRSVAVYSEADRDTLHVGFADEAYLVGETPPAASYLNIPNILAAASRSKADAIHPGYGFLAENAGFAQAVVDAELNWIGPPASAIVAMGDKVSARKVAASVGVESVPGTLKPIRSAAAIEKFASQHGWPVALKAAHGGGGRGFRVVQGPEDATAGLEGASREALLAFGKGDVYIERYLPAPRHVEIQIIGDKKGNVIHLGERDCSLQRRHQKLVEESPSPAVDEELRARMGAAAVKVAKAADYHSAGTIEFLLEQTEGGPRFWFLEMNTRLQVEHPVTELVTGVDLVKEMIRIAQGSKLSLSQGDLRVRGHAIEFRINAENPARNFLPNPGVITTYREPSGPGVRVDSGIVAGKEISQNYDSLIAKLICYGADRKEAIGRAKRALSEFQIGGLRTTIPFHQLAVGSRWFKDGDFSTKTVESDLDLRSLTAEVELAATTSNDLEHRMVAQVDGKRFEVLLIESADGSGDRRAPRPPDLARTGKGGSHGETLTAPMQGTIVKTLVAKGATVKAGEAIIVLEAMKMENMILCHRDGVVKEMKVKAGDTVSAGAQLAVIEGA